MAKKPNKPPAEGAPAKPEVAPGNTAGGPGTKPRSDKSNAVLVSEIRAGGILLLNRVREVAQYQTKLWEQTVRYIRAAKGHLDPAQAQLVAKEVFEAMGALLVVGVALTEYA